MQDAHVCVLAEGVVGHAKGGGRQNRQHYSIPTFLPRKQALTWKKGDFSLIAAKIWYLTLREGAILPWKH
ncbi:MAG: hypothetical protein R3C53_18830 [Pirellulaceae bacterium]